MFLVIMIAVGSQGSGVTFAGAVSSSVQKTATSSTGVTINAEANTYIDSIGSHPQGEPDQYGSTLIVGYEQSFGHASAVLRFALNNIDRGKAIKSASLKIYVSRVEKVGVTQPVVNLWGSYDDSWNEDSIQQLPSIHELISNDVKLFESIGGFWQTFDVTSFVKSRLTNNKATFVLKGAQSLIPGDLISQISFYDRRNLATAPQLEITYSDNSPPTDIVLSPNTIKENGKVGDIVGTLSASDPDPGETFTYSLTSGTSAPFTVVGNTLRAAQVFDYEKQNQYRVGIQVTDSAGNTFTKIVEVNILEVVEPPTKASITINRGAVITYKTNVTLDLAHDALKADMLEYRLSNESTTWSAWKSFETPVSWQLTHGDGNKTVFMELRDRAGAVLKAQDSIVLDTTPPIVTGVSNNGKYDNEVALIFNEGTATLNGSPFTSGTIVSRDGVYVLVVIDAAGNTTTVVFTISRISPTGSEVSIEDASLVADGTSQTTIKVTLRNGRGQQETTGGAKVEIASPLGTVGAVTDHNNGTYTATLTAPLTPGDATISARVNGSPITATAAIRFVPWEASISRSTVIASDQVVRANGVNKASLRVNLKDEKGNPIPGRQMQLQTNGGRSVIQAVYDVTNHDGAALFEVSNTAAEQVTYSAKEELSGKILDQTVNIAFTYDQPPSIVLQAEPITPTYDGVTISVSATVYGALNQISSIKWAPGSHDLLYFNTQGTEITDRFTVHENGIYSVYVRDAEGNANVGLIDIQHIVSKSNNANLSGWQLTGTGGTVSLPFDPKETNYKIDAGHSTTGMKMLLKTADANADVYVNGVKVASGALTSEFALAVGSNHFEIKVEAQDGTIKMYQLEVYRSGTGSDPSESTSSSSSSKGTPSKQPEKLDQSIVILVNGQKVTGAAAIRTGVNGSKYIEVLANRDMLLKARNDTNSSVAKGTITIAVPDEKPSKVVLRLPSDAAALLSDQAATIDLHTPYGEYRLPLAQLADQKSHWMNGAEVQITIEQKSVESLSGLKDAAASSGFQFVGSPVHYEVNRVQQDAKSDRDISRFGRFIEKVIFLPKDFTEKASTAALSDPKHGIRPVPTEFISIDGKQAAVIRSLTGSGVYVLVSKTSGLSDIQGHWAAKEIAELNERLIVNGVSYNEFVPNKTITRAEFTALLARALGLPESKSTETGGFRDVIGSSWYANAVSAVKAYGIMDGFKDGTFGPNREVTRQEAIVTIVRAMSLVRDTVGAKKQADLSNFTDRDQISNWASEAIRTAIEAGLIEGSGNELRPQQSLTRAEMAVFIHRMLSKPGLISGSK